MVIGHRFLHRAAAMDLRVPLPPHPSPQPRPQAPLSPISAASRPTLMACILIYIKVSFLMGKSDIWK